MKRLIAALLGCILICGAAGALATDEPNDGTLEDAIRSYLDESEYSYSYDEADRRFYYSMTIASNLRSCDVVINLKDDGFSVYAYALIGPERSKPEQMQAVAEYLTRANYGMYVGNFELDYDYGEVRFKTSTRCYDRVPGQEEIMMLVEMPVAMMERYGSGMISVMLAGADPAKMIDEAEGR